MANGTRSAAERADDAARAAPGTARVRGGPSAQGVVRTYDRAAPLYDLLFGRVLAPGRRALMQAVGVLRPRSVLEIGVGTGLLLPGYPPQSRVVGIDLSPEMLQRARQRAAQLPGRDIRLELMNAEAMDFPDASFDCVALPYVLSVTPDPARLVAEVRRVCRPDGAILLLNHFSGSPFWWLMERAVRPLAEHVGFRSDFGYEEHVLAHDWEVQAVRPVNLFRLSRLVVLRNAPRAAA